MFAAKNIYTVEIYKCDLGIFVGIFFRLETILIHVYNKLSSN